jgi:uncharacterized protein YaiI (UPF0178 family)
MISIILFIDADAFPVRQEIYRVAERHAPSAIMDAKTWMPGLKHGAKFNLHRHHRA